MNRVPTAPARHDGSFKRFFGKDITNLEDEYLPATKDLHLKDRLPARSHIKPADYENQKPSQSKPSPMQFCKNLLDNQRTMHRRGNTNEINKSGSIEVSHNASRGKLKLDSNVASLRHDVVKQ